MPRRTGGFIGHRGLQAPDPPTNITPTQGDEQVSIGFTAPVDVGDDAITGYLVQLSTDGTDYGSYSSAGSPSGVVIGSLTNGTAYTAKVWAINDYGTSAPSEASASVTPVVPPRGIIFGGGNTSALNIIEYITISSTGQSADFGDLTTTKKGAGAYSSTTRAVCHAGQKEASPYYQNIIDYVTIASTGNATNFGNLVGVRDNINDAGCASPTRGIFFGGYETGGNNAINVIQYITIGSTGNASDFGDMSASLFSVMACSSETRGVKAGGISGYINNIEYVTIASTGDSSDFGDLTAGRAQGGGTSSSTRGVFAGGETANNTRSNIIDYITIASAGNATDFGDLTATRLYNSMTSSDHGGVQ